MRRLIENLQNALNGFAEQSDDLVMVLAGDDAAAAIVLKMLRSIEASQNTDVFLLFATDFEDAESFADSIVAQLEAEHARASAALVEEGRPALPPFPKDAQASMQPPAARMHAALAFTRSLFPVRGGHRMVVAFCPLRVADAAAYAALITAFSPRAPLPAWQNSSRLIFRLTPDMTAAVTAARAAPRTRVEHADFGRDAVEKALAADAADPATPADDRTSALLQLAAFDMAYARTAPALAKYETLLKQFEASGNGMMQSHVLNGIGDVHRRAKNFDQAMHHYECAIVPAVQAKSAPLLQTTVRNLATLEYELRHFDRAEQYFGHLLRLAQHTQDANAIVMSFEYRGLSLEALQQFDPALECFDEGIAFCGDVGLLDDLRRNLAHLERVATRARKPERARAARAGLNELAAEEAAA